MRLRVIQTFIYLSFVAILARLWFWQIIESDNLTARAEQQRVSSKTLLAPRGSVLFADGSILAASEPTFALFAQPKIIKQKDQVAKTLAEIIWDYRYKNESQIEEEEKKAQILELKVQFLEKLSKDLFWVSLNQKVDLETKLKIDKENFYGVGFDPGLTRFYPEGSSSAHLLGFVSADDYGADTGYFGLEGYYNGELKGKNGSLTEDKDAMGLPILIGTYQVKDARAGASLTLNIDRTIQHIVENNLKVDIEKYGAKGASAVVMEPKTGAILALASYPNYDPADVKNFAKEYFKNPIVADGYEPGSTFKVLVMAAALNEGLVTPETICDICSGPYRIGGFTIRTWNGQYRPNSTITDVIVHSDNVGMVFTAQKLGIDKLYDYIQKFGIGKPTEVDLQDEYSPSIRDRQDWKEIDLVTGSFGQGISVTALQLVKAVAAIANGGILMEPHIVKSIQDDDKVTLIAPREVDRPITPETAKAISEMMVKAVELGEAKFYAPKGFKIAGKTGTAQIPVAGHYDPTKTIASFVGFAPADNPRFVMLTRFDQPSASIYGSETAAPTFFDIAKEIFTYYKIAPSNKIAP